MVDHKLTKSSGVIAIFVRLDDFDGQFPIERLILSKRTQNTFDSPVSELSIDMQMNEIRLKSTEIFKFSPKTFVNKFSPQKAKNNLVTHAIYVIISLPVNKYIGGRSRD